MCLGEIGARGSRNNVYGVEKVKIFFVKNLNKFSNFYFIGFFLCYIISCKLLLNCYKIFDYLIL